MKTPHIFYKDGKLYCALLPEYPVASLGSVKMEKYLKEKSEVIARALPVSNPEILGLRLLTIRQIGKLYQWTGTVEVDTIAVGTDEFDVMDCDVYKLILP